MMAMRRVFRLTSTPFQYILIFYAEGKEGPADFLQKQEMWPVSNSFPLAPAGEMSASVVCADRDKLRRQQRS